MRIDLVVQLREAAQAQRAGAPDGATTPLADQLDQAADEIARLRSDISRRALLEVDLRYGVVRLQTAIRRLAEQDATMSICNGNVTVEMDTPLTDEEREAIAQCADDYEDAAALCYERLHHADAAKRLKRAATLRGLLEKHGGGR